MLSSIEGTGHALMEAWKKTNGTVSESDGARTRSPDIHAVLRLRQCTSTDGFLRLKWNTRDILDTAEMAVGVTNSEDMGLIYSMKRQSCTCV